MIPQRMRRGEFVDRTIRIVATFKVREEVGEGNEDGRGLAFEVKAGERVASTGPRGPRRL